MFGNDRDGLRRFYLQCWQKAQQGQALDALEQQIAQVIREHPEYHALLTDKSVEREYMPEMGDSNPFLHMGLHLGLREQVATDRPAGIRAIYQELVLQQDVHAAEHRMMECLAESIWLAQRTGQAPDENQYLSCLRQLG